MKSWQCEQNVGWRKNRAINLCPCTSWIFRRFSATPRLLNALSRCLNSCGRDAVTLYSTVNASVPAGSKSTATSLMACWESTKSENGLQIIHTIYVYTHQNSYSIEYIDRFLGVHECVLRASSSFHAAKQHIPHSTSLLGCTRIVFTYTETDATNASLPTTPWLRTRHSKFLPRSASDSKVSFHWGSVVPFPATFVFATAY